MMMLVRLLETVEINLIPRVFSSSSLRMAGRGGDPGYEVVWKSANCDLSRPQPSGVETLKAELEVEKRPLGKQMLCITGYTRGTRRQFVNIPESCYQTIAKR